jgi:hypothetical protein
VDALLDPEPTTTLTVKAAYVRTSGSEEEKTLSYPVLPLEDAALDAGDVYQYTFDDLVPPVTRLFEVRHDLNQTQNPVPTGLDSDPYYKPFAPLSAGTGGIDQAQVDELAAQVGEVEADLVFLEDEVTDLQNEMAAKADLVAGKVPVSQLPAAGATAGVGKLYAGSGTNSDGAMTQTATRAALALKANLANTLSFVTETVAGAALQPGLAGGRYFSLSGTDVLLDDPTDDPTSYGRVNLYRVVGQTPATLNVPAGSAARIEGNPSATFQPGEWVVLRQVASGYQIAMRGNILGTGGTGGTATTTLVIDTVDGLRVSRAIPVLELCQVGTETLDTNATGLTYQLDTNTRTARVYGAPDRTKAQINALLAALTPTQLAEGALLYVKTVPAVPASPSTVYLALT